MTRGEYLVKFEMRSGDGSVFETFRKSVVDFLKPSRSSSEEEENSSESVGGYAGRAGEGLDLEPPLDEAGFSSDPTEQEDTIDHRTCLLFQSLCTVDHPPPRPFLPLQGEAR
jgi:hypothetical protein